nr:ABC transporter substrate-binding protein [Delftia tsuruhatensis]
MSSPALDRRTLLSLLGLGPLWSLPARSAAEPLTIAVGGQGLLYYLPLVIAQQLGYFEAEGLMVRIDDYPGGSQSLQALESGAADVCAGAYENTLLAQRRGSLLRAFVVQGRAPQIALGVASRWMPRYQTLADLRGRRVGVSSLGASTARAVQLMLLGEGLGPDLVELVGVGSGPEAMEALRTGRVHALCHADPLMSVLEDKGAVRIVRDLRDLRSSAQLYGGSMPSGTLYAPQDFLRRHPAKAQALSNAMVRSLKWLQTAAPMDVLRAVPAAYLLGSRRAYLSAFEHMRTTISPDGMMPVDGPATALRALARLDPGLAHGGIDLERSYTNEFVRQSRQRFHT